MAKQKTTRSKKFFSPFLLSLAGAAGWGATHSPPTFNSPTVVAAWLISALSVGLSVRAILALVGPILKLSGDLLRSGGGSAPPRDGNDL